MISEKRAICKHLFRDPLPEKKIIFWDTSFAVAAVFEREKTRRGMAAINFIQRLQKEKAIIAFSSILFDEFLQIALRAELIRSQGSRSKADRALQEGNAMVIRPHIKDIQKDMEALGAILSKFEYRPYVIFPTETGLVENALDLRCNYCLAHADSIHIASMFYGEEKNMVSFDREDFGKIAGISLWCKF